jgi:hypothetical protein
MNERFAYELLEADEQQRFRLLRQHLDEVARERERLARSKDEDNYGRQITLLQNSRASGQRDSG